MIFFLGFVTGVAVTLSWILILALCAAAARGDEALERSQREHPTRDRNPMYPERYQW